MEIRVKQNYEWPEKKNEAYKNKNKAPERNHPHRFGNFIITFEHFSFNQLGILLFHLNMNCQLGRRHYVNKYFTRP